MLRRVLLIALLSVAAADAAAQSAASTEGWPVKPVRFIVPFPAGSSSDTAARLVGQGLTQKLGQQLVIDNRGGASGNIGVELAAHAAPDGYTLVIGTTSTQALAPSLNPHLAYDPFKDFAAISMVGEAPYVLVVHPSIAATNVRELIALARTKSGAINYASAGPASLAHLAGELFASMANVQLTHVPYKTSAQSVIDLAAGRIEMQFATIAPVLPYIRNAQLRALAVTGTKPLTSLPDVPTADQAGLPGYEASLWYGILAPAGTPAPIIAKLNHDLVEILGTPAMKEALVAQGIEAASSTPEAFDARIRNDAEKWRKVIVAAGIHED